MVGITLSPEQVRGAPPEVRRWLEQELLASFGWQLPAGHPAAPHLIACSVEEASKVLSLIREVLPAVNVFFELGHEGASLGAEGLVAFRLVDIARHARLQNLQQVEACLEIINQAVQRVRGDRDAAFFGIDDRGYCYIADESRLNIARVWQETVADHDLEASKLASAQPTAAVARTEAQPTYPVWSAQPKLAESGAHAHFTVEPGAPGYVLQGR